MLNWGWGGGGNRWSQPLHRGGCLIGFYLQYYTNNRFGTLINGCWKGDGSLVQVWLNLKICPKYSTKGSVCNQMLSPSDLTIKCSLPQVWQSNAISLGFDSQMLSPSGLAIKCSLPQVSQSNAISLRFDSQMLSPSGLTIKCSLPQVWHIAWKTDQCSPCKIASHSCE